MTRPRSPARRRTDARARSPDRVRGPGIARLAPASALLLGTCAALLAAPVAAQAPVPVVTMLADFDDDSIGLAIGETTRVAPVDCHAKRVSIPARGSGSLALEIGATQPGASVVCDLSPRVATRFQQADRAGAFVWLANEKVRLAFRVRDDADVLFETATLTAGGEPRWLLVETGLGPDALKPVGGDARPVFPIRLVGVRVELSRAGKCVVNLDEVHVAHRVVARDSVRGDMSFDNPTRIFTPGAVVAALVNIENCSRSQTVSVACDLTWLRADGRVLKSQRRSGIELHASSADYRSRQPIDFSLRIPEPGLYRLVARVRAAGWTAPAVFESSIAVTPSNRNLSRGRQTFFGVRSRMLYESLADEQLELDLARALGVQLLALDVPWRELQPRADVVRLARLDALIEACIARDIAPMLCLADPPEWVRAPGASLPDAQASLLADLARHYGQRARLFQVVGGAADEARQLERAAASLRQVHADCVVLPRTPVGPDAATAAARLFAVSETAADALAARDAAGTRSGCGADDWWEFRAPPELGAGDADQAQRALRYFLRAAQAGVRGVIWSELRDRDNDPRRAEDLRGLVRRDFSPRNRLFGFAAAVGLLGGLHHVGPLTGAPPQFESAVFVGAKRQVAALIPIPGAETPALLAPVALAPGELAMEDAGRVRRPWLVESPLMVTTTSGLQFLTLQTRNAFPDAQIALSRPVVELPRLLWLATRGELALIARPAGAWRSSFVRVLPADGPIRGPKSAIVLSGPADEPIRRTIELRAAAAGFQSTSITLRFSIEGRSFEVPVVVGEQVPVRRLASGTDVTDGRYRVGQLRGPTPDAGDVHAAFTSDELRIAFRVPDDRRVPFSRTFEGIPRGDHVRLIASGDPGGAPVRQLLGASENLGNSSAAGKPAPEASSASTVVLASIAAPALGYAQLVAEKTIMIAAEFVDEDDGPEVVPLRFGDVSDPATYSIQLRLTD